LPELLAHEAGYHLDGFTTIQQRSITAHTATIEGDLDLLRQLVDAATRHGAALA